MSLSDTTQAPREHFKMRPVPPLIAASVSSPASAPSPVDETHSPATPPPANQTGGAVRLCVSKKYVLPPRPKPGRKASVELPSSRRKAQNREAQRAFRERRAVAAVELEEKLAEAAQRHAAEQAVLRRQIAELARENNNLRHLCTPPDTVYGGGTDTSNIESPLASAAAPVPAPAPPSSTATSPAFINMFSASPGYLVGPSPPAMMHPGMCAPSPAGFSLSPFVATSPGGNHLMAASVAASGAAHSPQNNAALELLDKVLEQKLPVPNDRRLSSSRNRLAAISNTGSSSTSPNGETDTNTGAVKIEPTASGGTNGSGSGSSSPTSSHSGSSTPTASNPKSPLNSSSSTVSSRNSNKHKPSPGKNSPRYVPPPPLPPHELVQSDWRAPAVPLRKSGAPLETDFTCRFPAWRADSRPRLKSERKLPGFSSLSPLSQSLTLAQLSSSPSSPSLTAQPPAPDDRCGFCSDGTPCLCAETAARGMTNMSDLETLGGTPSPLEKLAPSPLNSAPASTVAGVSTSPGPTAGSEPDACTKTPGTCGKCQEDPLMTLFCTALASRPGTSCSGGTFITAQAAYKTLSRHPHFAAADFGKVITSLDTRGTQVEVGSVARVLRQLDARQL